MKGDAHPYRGGVKASVYIDYDSLNSYSGATGYQVAKWANEGLHGGIEVDHKPHIWDDTMRETAENGEFLKLALEYLKSKRFYHKIIIFYMLENNDYEKKIINLIDTLGKNEALKGLYDQKIIFIPIE